MTWAEDLKQLSENSSRNTEYVKQALEVTLLFNLEKAAEAGNTSYTFFIRDLTSCLPKDISVGDILETLWKEGLDVFPCKRVITVSWE